MQLHLMAISHKHGVDVKSGLTVEELEDKVYEYVCEGWEGIPEDDREGMDPEKMPKADAISHYFSNILDEGEYEQTLEIPVESPKAVEAIRELLLVADADPSAGASEVINAINWQGLRDIAGAQ